MLVVDMKAISFVIIMLFIHSFDRIKSSLLTMRGYGNETYLYWKAPNNQ